MKRLSKAILAAGLTTAVVVGRHVHFRGPYRKPEPLPGEPILDVHCHVAGLGIDSGCYISPALADSWKLAPYLRGFMTSKREIKEKGDAIVVHRIAQQIESSTHVGGAVILGMDAVIDKSTGEVDSKYTEMYVPNDFVLEEASKHESIHPAISVNPYRKDAIERLEDGKRKGAVALKWLPSIMHIDPADRALTPFYEALRDLELPLLTHTGDEHSFTYAHNELCDPEKLRLPLSSGVTVIAAHVASSGKTNGESNINRLSRVSAEFPNLYSDISSLTQINRLGMLGQALDDPVYNGRLIYGTDYPLINTPLCHPAYHLRNLTMPQIARLSMIRNAFDRDVELKQALGVPANVFSASARLLKIEMPSRTA